jgi:peptide deformylase
MVKEIMKDPLFLSLPSVQAGPEDLPVGQDLLDTLQANAERCVGMAANMIGVRKRIIVFHEASGDQLMFNPEIIKQSDRYDTEEGCLSLTGVRRTQRWRSIKVRYQNAQFQTRLKTYTGWTAQIIQHEIDHCNGVLI